MSKSRPRKFKESLKNALRGLFYVVKTERNAKIILILGTLTLILARILKVDIYELPIILLTIGLVFIAEVFNTLVEELIDLFRKKEDPHIKILKDMASGAVLLSCLVSLGVALIIFLPKIVKLLK